MAEIGGIPYDVHGDLDVDSMAYWDIFEKSVREVFPDEAHDSTSKVALLLQQIAEQKRILAHESVPEFVFFNLDPKFTTIALTVPRADIVLPEDPSISPEVGNVVVRYQNNHRWRKSLNPQKGFILEDPNASVIIDSLQIGSEVIPMETIIQERLELLDSYFEALLGGRTTVEIAEARLKQIGIIQGSFLYRAINQDDWKELTRDGTLLFSDRDPSANFESQAMYDDERSQVKQYVQQTREGYAGKILRWSIVHPLLYRREGFTSPRIRPHFPHYLPATAEISSDAGATFIPIDQ